jgi:hypothetical protein
MSKLKNTPWLVDVLDETTNVEGPFYTIATDVSNHDAHLIAAAPDMLALLQKLHVELEMASPEVRRAVSYNELEQVIAKAAK